MVGQHGRARRIGEAGTPEPQETRTVHQRDRHLATETMDVRDLAPGDADVNHRMKLQPPAGQLEVAELIGAAASEAHRRGEVTRIAGGQAIDRPGQWQITARNGVREVERAGAGMDFLQLLPDVFVPQFELARPFDERGEVGSGWMVPGTLHVMPERGQAPWEVEVRGLVCHRRCHESKQTVLDLTIHGAYSSPGRRDRKIAALV